MKSGSIGVWLHLHSPCRCCAACSSELIPALRLSRADPQDALRSGSHTIGGNRRGIRVREWLVGAEVSLSTVLLVLAGLLVSSLWHVLHVDRGFAADRALEVRVSLPSRYGEAHERIRFFDLAADRLRALPGVRAVAAASRVPLTGESNVNSVSLEGGDQGALDPETRQLVMVNVRFVGADYFTALGIPLLRGRAIESADHDRNVAVVSGRLAAKLWPGQNPLGKVLTTGSGVSHVEVVGVVGDVHATSLDHDPTLLIYVPVWKFPSQVGSLVVRSANGAGVAPEEVRRTLQSIDSGIPAPKMRTMEELVEASVLNRRFQMDVAVAFTLAGGAASSRGSVSTAWWRMGSSLRRRELGIRIASWERSADRESGLVVWLGLRPVAVGRASGVIVAVAAGRGIRSLLWGVTPNDGWSLGALRLVLASIAILACLLPFTSGRAN